MNDPVEGPEYEFVADPLSDQVWDMWTGNATKNTEVFRHLFRADPDDNSTFLFRLPIPLRSCSARALSPSEFGAFDCVSLC